jgi:hypothetical protein
MSEKKPCSCGNGYDPECQSRHGAIDHDDQIRQDAERIQAQFEKEHGIICNQWKTDFQIQLIAFALRREREERDEEVDEFNAGFDAFEKGLTLDDEPSDTHHDQWCVGWVWAQHEKGKPPDSLAERLERLAGKYVGEWDKATTETQRFEGYNENYIHCVAFALRREREQFTEIINSAISWLETVSSSDGSGHADLAKRLKKMSENMAPRPDPIAERLERLLDELYDDSIGSYPEQAAHISGWNAALEAIRFHMEGE